MNFLAIVWDFLLTFWGASTRKSKELISETQEKGTQTDSWGNYNPAATVIAQLVHFFMNTLTLVLWRSFPTARVGPPKICDKPPCLRLQNDVQ